MPAVQAEDERRQAVGEPDGDDAERAAALEREPHQRDVVERVAELADRDGEEQVAEVAPPQEREATRPARAGVRRQLPGDVEDRVGHAASLPSRRR